MSTKPIPIRFELEEYEAIKEYANTHTNGNFSRAVKDLCAYALVPAQAQTAIEHRVEAMIEEGVERMAKVASRGVKASLANLAINCSYLPAIGDGMRTVGDMLLDTKRGVDKELAEEALDAALYTASDKVGISQNQLFLWGWEVAGRLQSQEGKMSLYEATKRY